MIKPRLEEYLHSSKEYRYVPLYVKIMGDSLTPVQVYRILRKTSPYSYLLESVQQNEKLGRFSWIGLDPIMTFKSNGRDIEVELDNGEKRRIQGNPLENLFEVMEDFRPAIPDDLYPYQGGMVGYFGYDTVRHVEEISDDNPDDLRIPESLFILPKTVVVFDHLYQSITLIVQIPAGNYKRYLEGKKEIQELLNLLSASRVAGSPELIPAETEEELDFSANMTQADYMEAVEKAKSYIVEGDIFQVVLSLRFSMPYADDPFEVYRSLRRVNPSPYLFYLHYPDFQVAGSSPEILVKRSLDTLTLRPIAGTRRRGATPEEDQRLAEEMMNDPKEIAEHMMLVDLGRNDLGRVSKFGTVEPTQFKYIENYSHVMHIVTNLESTIAEGKSNSDLVQATFPAGTLSGAPKVRAMEIIDELEVSRRGFYGGAVANIDFKGNFDSCIGIRSVVMKDDSAYIQAGAGIVADSVPEREYEECLNKAKAVMKAVQLTGRTTE
ncbi:MAG: anthranilate synthase component I [Proteobacteria bacterium]|nr:anthranilate synthase component I [Pseudomonadota bacterium]